MDCSSSDVYVRAIGCIFVPNEIDGVLTKCNPLTSSVMIKQKTTYPPCWEEEFLRARLDNASWVNGGGGGASPIELRS
jgi:hypothetical protein